MFSDQLFERFFFGEIVLDAVQCRSSFPFGEFPADISINNEFVPGDYERVRKSEIPLLVQCSQLERLYRQIVSGVAKGCGLKSLTGHVTNRGARRCGETVQTMYYNVPESGFSGP